MVSVAGVILFKGKEFREQIGMQIHLGGHQEEQSWTRHHFDNAQYGGGRLAVRQDSYHG